MDPQISCWQDPPQKIIPGENELHLWRISLNVSFSTQQQLKNTLSPDEHLRADRLLDPKKAGEFVVARGCLRQILGKYLNIPATELGFNYGSEGKPALHDDFNSALSFNLSHSGEWALLGVTSGTEVGVDLEKIDSQIDWLEIATRYFEPAEKIRLKSLSEQRQRRGFYRLWTYKEASLKRFGFGFSGYAAPENTCRAGLSQVFPIWKNYLGAFSANEEITSILRYQLTKN